MHWNCPVADLNGFQEPKYQLKSTEILNSHVLVFLAVKPKYYKIIGLLKFLFGTIGNNSSIEHRLKEENKVIHT